MEDTKSLATEGVSGLPRTQCNDKGSTSTESFISKLVKEKDEGELEFDSESRLSQYRVHELHSRLNTLQCKELLQSQPEIFVLISQHVAHLIDSEDISDVDVEKVYFSNKIEHSKSRNPELAVNSWVHSGEGSMVIGAITAQLCAIELMIRFLDAFLFFRSKSAYASELAILASMPISGDHIEKSLLFINRVLTANYTVDGSVGRSKLSINCDTGATSPNRNASKRTKRKSSADGVDTDEEDQNFDDMELLSDDENVLSSARQGNSPAAQGAFSRGKKSKLNPETRRLLIELNRAVCPTLIGIILGLESWFLQGKQRDRIVFSACQLVFLILGLDPISNPRAECLDFDTKQMLLISRSAESIIGGGSLTSPLILLQKCSISLLRELFQLYDDQRVSILNDMLPLFAQIYASKSPSKPCSLHNLSVTGLGRQRFPRGDAATSGEGQHVTAAFAALLCILQSVGASCADALTEVEYASPMPTDKDIISTKSIKSENKRKRASDPQTNQCKEDLNGSKVLSLNLKASVTECRRFSSIFLTEFLKRCEHKDMSGEYRVAILQLVDECLVAVASPNFPICTIFLEQLVSRIVVDLNSTKSVVEGLSGAKKDFSLVFLSLELIGTVGAKIRPLIVDTESKHETIQNGPSSLTFSAHIHQAIQTKCERICQFWKAQIAAMLPTDTSAECSLHETGAEVLVGSSKSKVIKGKGKKSRANLTIGDGQSNFDALPLFASFRLVADVMAATLEASTSADLAFLDNGSRENRDVDADSSSSQLLYLGPEILSRSFNLESLMERIIPKIELLDELSYQHWEYLLHSIDQRLYCSSNSPIIRTESSLEGNEMVCAYEPSGMASVLRDGTFLALCIWFSDANQRTAKHSGMEVFIESLSPHSLRNERESLSSKTHLSSSEELLRSAFSVNSSAPSSTLNPDFEIQRVYFSSEYVQIRYKQLISMRSFGTLFENILSTVLVMFTNGTPTVRAKAMKTLSKLVGSNPALLSRDSVRAAVTERFNDVSISVREEAVKLVGTFVVRGCDVLDNYIDGILIRLRDKGVSVRKTVVGIIREILLQQPGHPRYSELCLHLLERSALPKEEDSIRDTIQSTFQKLWFLPTAESAFPRQKFNHLERALPLAMTSSTVSIMGDQCGLDHLANVKGSRPQRSLPNSGGEQYSIQITAAQIVEVVGKMVDLNWMVILIREMLHGRSLTGDEGQRGIQARKESSEKQCASIVDALVEILLRCEEQDPLLLEQISGVRELSDHFVLIIHTIAIFSEAHPPLVVPHITTLLPYLKGHSGLNPQQDAAVCLEVSRILESAALIDRGTAKVCISETCEDLTNIALKYGPPSVSAAISCLSALIANCSKDIAPVHSLAQKCFFSIAAIANQQLIDKKPLLPAQIGRLQRCLLVYGAICEFRPAYMHITRLGSGDSELSDTEIAKLGIQHIKTVSPNALCGPCFSAALYCLELNDPNLQARSVQTICSIFIGCPKLIIQAQESGLLDNFLSSAFPAAVHERLLHSLALLMKSEEVRLETGAAFNQMKDAGVTVSSQASRRVLGPVDVESDASIVGFMLQQRLPTLLAFLSRKSASLRLAALLLLGTLLRQGMLCPLDLISRLIGLQGDPDVTIRSESLHILQTQDERHPFFLDNRFVEGVEAAFEHQLNVLGGPQPLDGIPDEAEISGSLSSSGVSSVFKHLYTSCVQGNRRRKNDFFNGMVRKAQQYVEFIEKCEYTFCKVETVTAVPLAASNEGPVTAGSHIAELEINDNCSDFNSSTKSVLISNSAGAVIPGIALPITNAKELTDKYQMLIYLLTTLAYLPYDSSDEPLLVIYGISKYVPFNAGLLLNRMKQTVKLIGASNRGASNLMLPPALGQRAKKPSGIQISGGMEKESFVWDEALLLDDSKFNSIFGAMKGENSNMPPEGKEISRLYCAAICQSIEICCFDSLLRLKYFLKLAYGFSDERCQSFNPEDRVGAQALNFSSIGDSHEPQSTGGGGSPTINKGPSNNLSRFSVVSYEKVRVMDAAALPLFSMTLCNESSIWDKTFSADTANSVEDKQIALIEHVSTAESVTVKVKPWICAAIANYNNLLVLLEGDPNDFILAKKKRSRGRPRLEGCNSSTGKGSSRTGTKKIVTKKRRTSSKYSDEDDEPDDFDDFVPEDDDDTFGGDW